MSRVANPYDNAKAESFFKTLKAELVYPGWLGQLLTTPIHGLANHREMLRHLGEHHAIVSEAPPGASPFRVVHRCHPAIEGACSPALRLDMPGHIKHAGGDTFKQIFLSYHGDIPSSQFTKNFAPDERYNYRRGENAVPERFIRAYQLRDPETGNEGPWLAVSGGAEPLPRTTGALVRAYLSHHLATTLRAWESVPRT